MNQDQAYTPKYWVVHDPFTDDIIPETMSKSRDGAYSKFLGNARRLFSHLNDEEFDDVLDRCAAVLIEVRICQ